MGVVLVVFILFSVECRDSWSAMSIFEDDLLWGLVARIGGRLRSMISGRIELTDPAALQDYLQTLD
jgi:hypothetical protein